MNLKDFIKKTVEDTIEFMRVPIRFLEDLRDQTQPEQRAQGIQDAIDYLRNFIKSGEKVSKLVIDRKYKELKRLMYQEANDDPNDPSKLN